MVAAVIVVAAAPAVIIKPFRHCVTVPHNSNHYKAMPRHQTGCANFSNFSSLFTVFDLIDYAGTGSQKTASFVKTISTFQAFLLRNYL